MRTRFARRRGPGLDRSAIRGAIWSAFSTRSTTVLEPSPIARRRTLRVSDLSARPSATSRCNGRCDCRIVRERSHRNRHPLDDPKRSDVVAEASIACSGSTRKSSSWAQATAISKNSSGFRCCSVVIDSGWYEDSTKGCHRIEAGRIFPHASRFEPAAQQMYSQRYGTLPSSEPPGSRRHVDSAWGDGRRGQVSSSGPITGVARRDRPLGGARLPGRATLFLAMQRRAMQKEFGWTRRASLWRGVQWGSSASAECSAAAPLTLLALFAVTTRCM